MNDNNGQCGAIFPSGAATCALRLNHLGPCRDWRGVADDRTNLEISNDFLKREVARLETFIANRSQETFRPTPAPLGDPDRTRLHLALEDIEALKMGAKVTTELAGRIDALSRRIDTIHERLGERINDLLRLLRETHR